MKTLNQPYAAPRLRHTDGALASGFMRGGGHFIVTWLKIHGVSLYHPETKNKLNDRDVMVWASRFAIEGAYKVMRAGNPRGSLGESITLVSVLSIFHAIDDYIHKLTGVSMHQRENQAIIAVKQGHPEMDASGREFRRALIKTVAVMAKKNPINIRLLALESERPLPRSSDLPII